MKSRKFSSFCVTQVLIDATQHVARKPSPPNRSFSVSTSAVYNEMIMSLLCLRASLFFIFLSCGSTFYVLNSSSLNCSQQDLPCEVNINKCLYPGWLDKQQFTPSDPVDLQVHWEVRKDENGLLVPVIVAQWKAKDDGSISYLKGTEFQVTKQIDGSHLCVHYKFLQNFVSMKAPDGKQWSFSLDRVVVEPEQQYWVSVSNLPKPNLNHTNYDVVKTLNVPSCNNPLMRTTSICLEQGWWEPNITMRRHEQQLSFSFNTSEHCETYKFKVKCNSEESRTVNKKNMSVLNVTFDLEAWPRTCCIFDAQIQPFCSRCTNDCYRKKQSFIICPDPDPEENKQVWLIFAGSLLLLCSVLFCAMFLCYRRKRNVLETLRPSHSTLHEPLAPAERSVLIIYSRDHPLYTDIVLKLCAFLRAKCGTQVYLDLLDTASIGAMGRLQWTELQKRRIEQSANKVLVLCSRGVQAKWGAMCGGPRLYLREDVRSPMGDMLTLALHLITPDMQRPASYGKYLVAYFEDISGEHDVPSMFDLAIKYKLMKQFEDLYFRILDLEKYQCGKIHKIEGIDFDEYFNCSSGKALKDAIETFQAYQLDSPDWFERECLDDEDNMPQSEEISILDQCPEPILRCDPVINSGPPVCEYEVEVHDIDHTPSVWTYEISNLVLEPEEPSLLNVQSVPSQLNSLYPSVEPPLLVHASGMYPTGSEIHSCLQIESALQQTSPPCRNEVSEDRTMSSDGFSAEYDEEALKQLQHFQIASLEVAAPPPSVAASWDLNSSQPVEMEESEMLEASGNRQSRWSDQGYSSRDSVVREEPLVALAKLQEVLFRNSPSLSGFCTDTMQS